VCTCCEVVGGLTVTSSPMRTDCSSEYVQTLFQLELISVHVSLASTVSPPIVEFVVQLLDAVLLSRQ
jgi:hypothetical protein